ncbi:MAG: hypothetical protein K0Q49_1984 [Haloplasmataceae bacterium]|jgi:hypothetical protein|nr:hypothetical protein [Haloplasmataceae bacterium]
MFLNAIAIFFLILFLIKILSPNVFPVIRRFFNHLLTYINEIFKILLNSFLRSITLLITKTVFVVGIVVLATLVISTVYTTIKYPNIMEIKTWFFHFKDNILNIYVYTFFLGTYILGIMDYLKDKSTISSKFMSYIETQFRNKNQKQYVYDEETKKYIYK